MSFASVSVLVVLAIASATAKLDSYCSICRDHTMCRYQGTGPACENIGTGGVTEFDKRKIVDLHNSYRRRVAKGLENRGTGGPQPHGANMRNMIWDDELAAIAQRWADQCLFQHDSCRDTTKMKVGQNIYWSWRIPATGESNWTAAVESWYEEVTKFNAKNVQKYQFQSSTGHYTQVVWANTYLIGCGMRNYGPNKLYVCNYGPAGNWLDDSIYIIGPACSSCPKGTTCNDGLCDGKSDGRRRPQKQGTNIQSPSFPSPRFGQPPSPLQKYLGEFKELQRAARPTNDNYDKKEQDPTAKKLNLIDDSSVTTLEDVTTTEVPISFNIIDDLDIINNDEEIKREIEYLKLRILELAQKITEKRNARFSSSE